VIQQDVEKRTKKSYDVNRWKEIEREIEIEIEIHGKPPHQRKKKERNDKNK